MSGTLIPEADLERLTELEENGETDKLKALANKALEESEIIGEYDIGYGIDIQKSKEQSGTHYSSNEVSPYYDGDEPEIEIPFETSVDEFYASLDGEFRVVENDGEIRAYNLVMSCDDGMLLKGEIELGGRQITEFRYSKGDSLNRLQVHLDGEWRKFGEAEEIGEGNKTMTQIELIDSAYKQLKQEDTSKNTWEINYSTSLENDLEELPSQIESTFKNKTEAFEQNLELGVEPRNILSAMSPPWKPLLEMKLGSNYRAMFISSSNLSQNQLPQDLKGRKCLIGLSVGQKLDFKKKFETKEGGLEGNSGNVRTNGLNYAINVLNKE